MNFYNIFNEISQRVLPIFKHYRSNIKNLEIQLKADNSLLTQADIEIQDVVVETILKHDPDAGFIAEEKSLRRSGTQGRLTWVIDPIDGTRPFTSGSCYEYCCTVCALDKGIPVASMILMPEIGHGKTPILATGLLATNEIFINGEPYKIAPKSNKARIASTTRARTAPPSKIEEWLIASGIGVKIDTTSLIIDLLRTAIDISPYSDMDIGPFKLFNRGRLMLWDIAPGICFNIIAGKRVIDLEGNDVLPYPDSIINSDDPVSPAVIIAESCDVEEILGFL